MSLYIRQLSKTNVSSKRWRLWLQTEELEGFPDVRTPVNKSSKFNGNKACQSKSWRLNSRDREMAYLKGRHINIILTFYSTLAIWWEVQEENPSTLNSAEQYPAFEHWHQNDKENKVLNLRISTASMPRTKARKDLMGKKNTLMIKWIKTQVRKEKQSGQD